MLHRNFDAIFDTTFGFPEWGLHKIYGCADEANIAFAQPQQKIGLKQ